MAKGAANGSELGAKGGVGLTMEAGLESGEEKILKRIPWEILALAATLALGGLVAFDAGTGLFVFLGGVLSSLGFVSLRKSVTRFLQEGKGPAVRSALFLYGLRLILIIALFSIIILFFPGRIYAFIAGFSMVIPVFLIEAAAALSRMKPWKH
jgi:hypothetical protein